MAKIRLVGYNSGMNSRFLPIAVLLLTLILTASCHATTQGAKIIQPGAPGTESHVISRDRALDLSQVQATKADIEFMQGMIHHHLQAMDMTNLLAQNTNSDDMRKLGLRMSLSQSDEIKMMRHWLEIRGQDAPGDHAHHMPGAPTMPGMLSAEEMDHLAAAKGVEFDKLFLEGMIKHHTGALVMVDQLFKMPGAAQQSEVFAFATDVEADQRAEIDRMTAMLKELQKQ
jgi:uncharacterized protein (DUF305 family)